MHRASALFFLFCSALITGCGSGSSSSSNTTGNSGNGNISVSITPTAATVVTGQTEMFQATVSGSTNSAVTWEVNQVAGGNSTVGTISATGVYTAPPQVPTPASVSVSAVAQADSMKSALATVQVVTSNPNQQAQHIPVKLGSSGGNANDSSTQGNLIHCCGGTLGALVERNGTFYILSNNHILARNDIAQVGDPIIQPGLIDSNCVSTGDTTVGNLSQFVNLETAGANVDAALAQVVSGTVDPSGSILLLGSTSTGGVPDAGAPHAGDGIGASLGEAVAKSGRTTGLTCSTVGAINVFTSVSYQKGCGTGTTFSVTYSGQISIAGGTFSGSGDSGSLIVDQTTADPVALLYGGSDTDTVGNPVADVLIALQDTQGHKPTFVGNSSSHAVAGCTATASSTKTVAAVAPTIPETKLAQAARARDIHAPELLAIPYVQAIGVGASVDHPGEAAVILVVHPGQIPTALPDQLEGIPTRIVPSSASGPHGVFEPETAARIAPVVDTFAVQAIAGAELARAKAVQSAHADELMKQTGVQGVGITSSADAPGQAALMIFVVRGVSRNPIPPLIDGLRTRVRESSRFTAGQRGGDVINSCKVPVSQTASRQLENLTIWSLFPDYPF